MDFSEPELATLRAVAGFFSCELVPDEDYNRCRVAVCEAFSLSIRKNYRTQKARFVAILPEGISPLGSVDGVNVSLQRPALAIARDLQRRLIPQATQWAQRCRDHSANLRHEKQVEGEFLARIFAANRSEPTRWRNHGSWSGKGFEIERYHGNPARWGEYVATVKVRSIQALEQIAAICAEDVEFHTQKTKPAAKFPAPSDGS
jgi:hypothetical protein